MSLISEIRVIIVTITMITLTMSNKLAILAPNVTIFKSNALTIAYGALAPCFLIYY